MSEQELREKIAQEIEKQMTHDGDECPSCNALEYATHIVRGHSINEGS